MDLAHLLTHQVNYIKHTVTCKTIYAPFTEPVTPQDILIAPDYDLDTSLHKTLIVKAGTTIKVEIPISGRPAPNVIWVKGLTNNIV